MPQISHWRPLRSVPAARIIALERYVLDIGVLPWKNVLSVRIVTLSTRPGNCRDGMGPASLRCSRGLSGCWRGRVMRPGPSDHSRARPAAWSPCRRDEASGKSWRTPYWRNTACADGRFHRTRRQKPDRRVARVCPDASPANPAAGPPPPSPCPRPDPSGRVSNSSA